MAKIPAQAWGSHNWRLLKTKFSNISSSVSKTCEKPDGKPVEDLDGRHEAEAEAKAAKSTNVGDEFKTSHLLGSLVLWA